MDRDTNLRRQTAAWCLIAAPLVITIGDLLSMQAVLSRYAQHSYSGLVVHLVSMVFLLGAILGLAHLLRGPAPRYALTVGAAAVIGFLGGTNIMAVRLHIWALQTSLDSTLYDQVKQGLSGEAQAALAPVIFGPGLFTPLSLLLAGLGLWRWTRLPRWSLALLLLGAVLFPAGRISATLSLILLSDALLLVSMIFLGFNLLRRPEQWSGSATVASEAAAA